MKRRGFLAFFAVIPFIGKLAKPRPMGVSVTMVGGGGGGGSGRYVMPGTGGAPRMDGAPSMVVITEWTSSLTGTWTTEVSRDGKTWRQV